MYGVDGYWDAEGDGGDPLAWAKDQWNDDGVENAGAVYDQDEMFEEFCGCVDSFCSGPSLSDVEIPIRDDCDKHMFEFVYGINGVNDTEDDEFVTMEYRGLRDVDAWQRHDP